MSELDYVERSDGIYRVTVHSNGDNSAQLFIQGNPIMLDGETRVCVEMFAPAVEPDFNQSIVFDLYEILADGTLHDLGMMSDSGTGGKSSDVTRSDFTAFARRFFTPTSGQHTYQIRVWATGGSLNRIYCGFGGGPDPGDPPNWMPAYYRITVE